MNAILDEEMPRARRTILLKHYCATYLASGRRAEDRLNIRSFSLRRENPAQRVRQTLTKPGGIFG